MAKGITLKTKNGATGYPKSVTDLIFDNATGKTLKTLIDELKAIDAATDTRTQFYKASVTDLDALNAAANIGTYNYVGNGWRGLVQVCLDHSSNVAQVALSSSSPSYDGNVLSWIAAQPCAMARVYRNGAWSHWEKVGAPVVNDLTTGGTEKALSAEMGKTLKEGLDALGPKIDELEEGLDDIAEETREAVNDALDAFAPISISGDVDNAPDEEDLTSVNNGSNDVIRFKDKTYAPLVYSGKGRKFMRKNIVNGNNVLTQSMFQQSGTGLSNTTFIIQYDYVLGENITIPNGCTLDFQGGSIKAGTGQNTNTITFNATTIKSDSKCFGEGLAFSGNIVNDEVLISWFVDGSEAMSAARDFTHDTHDAIISAMKLANRIRGNETQNRYGWLNMQRLPIAVLSPIVIDGSWGEVGIRNANISFVSSADGQSLFVYNYAYTQFTAVKDSIFIYKGSADNTWHERVSCIRLQSWGTTCFCYWRDIVAKYWTGYFMVNQTYLQEVTFENITVNSGGGFITFNGERYYGNTNGSANIVHFLNVNINACGIEGQSAYSSKCTVPYLWSFVNYMEISLKNIVSQGVGFEGQEVLWLGGGNLSQTCVLDGFWTEFTSGNVGIRARISGSCNVHLYKNNVTGFYTVGNQETINIFVHSVTEDFYGGHSFIDRSEIAEGTANVSVFLDNSIYLQVVSLSDKFVSWMDNGIIRSMTMVPTPKTTNLPYPAMSIATTEEFDAMAYLAAYLRRSKRLNGINVHLDDYNGIPILVAEATAGGDYHSQIRIKNEELNKHGEISEFIYRVAPIVDVTEENKNNVYFKDNWLAGPNEKVYIPEVGTTAGTYTGWLRRVCIRRSGAYNPSLSWSIYNCRVEIAYCSIKALNAIRDYGDIIYDPVNKTITRKPYPPRAFHILETTGVKLDDILVLIGDCQSPIYIDGNIIQKDSSGGVHTAYPVKGTTSNRPTLTSASAGLEYYDTTLNKLIVWSGSAWVNVDGSALT